MNGFGWVKGKDLPKTLFGCGKKINETISPRPQVPNAKGGRQRSQVEKDTASSSSHLFSSFKQCLYPMPHNTSYCQTYPNPLLNRFSILI
jgi:hypothetical protein